MKYTKEERLEIGLAKLRGGWYPYNDYRGEDLSFSLYLDDKNKKANNNFLTNIKRREQEMKKISSIFLGLMLTLALLPAGIFAGEGETTNVAKIGTTEYATLQAAVDAATDGATIILLKNVNTDSTIVIPEGKNIILNTNGKTLTSTATQYAINNLGTLTINGGGVIVHKNPGNSVVRTLGKLTLEKVAIETPGDGKIAVKVDENGKDKGGSLIVNEGTLLEAQKGQAIQAWGDVTINDGYMDGDVTAWSVNSFNPGNITVNGGTIDGNVSAYQSTYNNGAYPSDPATININDGSVFGNVDIRYANIPTSGDTQIIEDTTNFKVDGDIDVSGGSFENKVDSKYIDEDAAELRIVYSGIDEGETYSDEYYFVGTSDEVNKYAKEAVEAMDDGETLTLDVVTGDVALTDIKDGVIVKNSGNGKVSVNNVAVAPGKTVVAKSIEKVNTADDSSMAIALVLAILGLCGTAAVARKKNYSK